MRRLQRRPNRTIATRRRRASTLRRHSASSTTPPCASRRRRRRPTSPRWNASQVSLRCQKCEQIFDSLSFEYWRKRDDPHFTQVCAEREDMEILISPVVKSFDCVVSWSNCVWPHPRHFGYFHCTKKAPLIGNCKNFRGWYQINFYKLK